MTAQHAEALRPGDHVVWWDDRRQLYEQPRTDEAGIVVVCEPAQHYLVVEWGKDRAQSHLDTRDCEDLHKVDWP